MLAKIFSFWAMHPGWVPGAAFLLFSLSPPAYPQAPQSDLTEMNIEDLMKIEVTSVSRHEQPLSQTAAAAFVITEEDILHSGAENVPELLRMVPGVQVAQINASSWAISVRGCSGRFSNKVLVMVDGRTVYVPSYGGVFYDVLDVPLEQIARIEVIRGPGGSIWGSNAVNGVINILTKKAGATPGTTVVGGGEAPAVDSDWCRRAINLAAPATSEYSLNTQPMAACARRTANWKGMAGTSCMAGSAPIPKSPRKTHSPCKVTSIPGEKARPYRSLSRSHSLLL